jgi:hypothetical protein
MSDKYIVLRLDKPPEFHGVWVIGEILALLDALKRWIENIPLSQDEPKTE